MSADVIIIGAGVGGLTTAAILAHQGVETLVLESSNRLGGRFSYQEKEGFNLDYGVHGLPFADEGAASAAFSKAGLEIDLLTTDSPLLYYQGEFLPFPNKVSTVLRSKMLSLKERLYLLLSLAKLVLSKPEKNYDTPLEDIVFGINQPGLRTIMEFLSGVIMVCPDISRVSAGEFQHFLKKTLRAKEAVAIPKGGSKQLILKLKDRIEENGKISTDTKVDSLIIKKGKVQGVRSRGETIPANAVVCAVPLQNLGSLVEKGTLPGWFLKATKELEPNGGISLDVALSRPISDIKSAIATVGPMTMGYFTSNIDPSVAPGGKQLLTFFYPLSQNWIRSKEKVEKETERLRAMLSEMFPELESAKEWERLMVLPMVDGFVPVVGQDRNRRAAVVAPNVPNLFFAGDTTDGAGKGGDVAFNSAVEAARSVEEYLGEEA